MKSEVVRKDISMDAGRGCISKRAQEGESELQDRGPGGRRVRTNRA